MKVVGRVIRTGVPLPPAVGPGRLAMMYQDGIEVLKESARLYGQCLRSMAQTWGVDLSQMPAWEATTEAIQRCKLHSGKAQRDFLVEVWSGAENCLRRAVNQRVYTSPLLIGPSALRAGGLDHRQYTVMADVLSAEAGPQVLDYPWRDLERRLRLSLSRAVDAFNFLEDTELAEFAHQHAHKIAALVGGIFGCGIEYSDGTYWDTCPLSHMHHRCGLSLGFTATRCCSLCGDDLDLCEHLLDTRYEVQIQRTTEGTCNACGRRSCSHNDGEVVLAYPHAVMGDMQIHEVSLVRRPRDPLARITKAELDTHSLAPSLGGDPGGRNVRCYRCLQPCAGFTRPQD